MEIEIIRFFQSWASEPLSMFFKIISYASHYWGFIAFLVILFFLVKNKLYSLMFAITYGLGVGLNYVLKFIITKPRPYVADETILNIMESTGYSMPSGHSVSITIMCVFMIYAIMRVVKPKWLKSILTFVCFALVPLTMIARMYLGQHYLSDTVVGVCLGLFIGLVGIFCYKKLTEKKVEIKDVKEIPLADNSDIYTKTEEELEIERKYKEEKENERKIPFVGE